MVIAITPAIKKSNPFFSPRKSYNLINTYCPTMNPTIDENKTLKSVLNSFSIPSTPLYTSNVEAKANRIPINTSEKTAKLTNSKALFFPYLS